MPIYDVTDIVQRHLPAPSYYIENLLVKEGSMMVYGGAGIRKSWLVQHLAFCLATGSPWLGFQTEQAKVLLTNFEISHIPFVVLRLRPMSRVITVQPGWLYEYSPGIKYLEDPATFNAFREAVRAIAPKIIILDCLQACYGGDESDMEKASAWIRNVVTLKEEFGASVIIVHHSNKNQLATSMGRMRGTTRFAAWTDTVIYMAEQPTGSQLQFEKYRMSRVPELHNLNIKFENYVWDRV